VKFFVLCSVCFTIVFSDDCTAAPSHILNRSLAEREFSNNSYANHYSLFPEITPRLKEPPGEICCAMCPDDNDLPLKQRRESTQVPYGALFKLHSNSVVNSCILKLNICEATALPQQAIQRNLVISRRNAN
jgi:hypothetical protein